MRATFYRQSRHRHGVIVFHCHRLQRPPACSAWAIKPTTVLQCAMNQGTRLPQAAMHILLQDLASFHVTMLHVTRGIRKRANITSPLRGTPAGVLGVLSGNAFSSDDD